MPVNLIALCAYYRQRQGGGGFALCDIDTPASIDACIRLLYDYRPQWRMAPPEERANAVVPQKESRAIEAQHLRLELVTPTK
jgi:hypothetical protein